VIDYVPTGRPGHRAPHIWLERDGEPLSTLDLFGPGFALLTGPAGKDWVEAAATTGDRFGVAIGAHTIGGGGGLTAADDWTHPYGMTNDGAVLVRPDGHVAWRSAGGVKECARVLASALGGVLGF
jgi:hypothetical protein